MLNNPESASKVVLITGINYWPEETGNAPYTTLMAEHFASNGYQVYVVTGMPYYPAWRIASQYERTLRRREDRNGVQIHRFRQVIPGSQSALKRAAFELTFFLNAMVIPDIPRPDVILGIVPSLGGAGLAYAFSKRYRVPYGLIFQDLVGAAATQSGMPGGNRVARLATSIEGAVARNAAQISIISPGFKPYLEELGVGTDRIRRIPNWTHITPPNDNREQIRVKLGWSPETTVVLHAGAMGLKQGLEHVISAARAAIDFPQLQFVLMGDGSQRRDLERLSRGLSNLSFLPPAPSENFPDILAAADILLINERASIKDMALPSKLTSYLVAGRPIVAAVSQDGWTAKEVKRTGAGLVVSPEDPGSLAQALIDLGQDPKQMIRLGQAGPAYATTELEADSVLDRYIRLLVDVERSKAGDSL